MISKTNPLIDLTDPFLINLIRFLYGRDEITCKTPHFKLQKLISLVSTVLVSYTFTAATVFWQNLLLQVVVLRQLVLTAGMQTPQLSAVLHRGTLNFIIMHE